MSGFKRNIMVGVTVLVTLVLLGWMILRFSDAPFRLFAKPQMHIRFIALSAEGMSEGSGVSYKGVPVGRITSLKRSDDQRFVIMDAMVDMNPPLPGNVEGRIRSQLLGGGSTMTLVLANPPRPAPGTGPASRPVVFAGEQEPQPIGQLVSNQDVIARYVGVDILPREFTDLASDLRDTSEEFRKLSRKLRESDIIPDLAAAANGLRRDIDKAGKVLDSLDSLVNDAGMRKNIQESLANFRAASESATRIGGNLEKLSADAKGHMDDLARNGNKVLTTAQTRIDDISRQLGDRLAQTAKILEDVQGITRKINQGQGSAAQLINNPSLYENLLDTSRELKATMADVRRLVEQWEQEGVFLKLK